eukprot:Seg480.3 transcript_id=Seg480.3/GoldUCD/mRNA.D3Y31 product="hypothetical protein" protein_id=Seg480.3/GoldUCD/D3Y31
MATGSVIRFSSCKSFCWLLCSILLLNTAIIQKRIIKQRRLQTSKPFYLHDASDLHGFEPTINFGLRNRLEGHGPNLRSKYNQSRIPYYAGNGSQTFQLLKDASILLIVSGDIEPNPGPVKNPCSSCNRAVAKNHRALLCSSCSNECHIGPKCGNVSITQYKTYKKTINYTWECPTCVLTAPCNQALNSTGDFSRIRNPALHFPMKGFSIFQLNTRSIFHKLDEIRVFVKQNPYHVLAFSETWLQKSVSNSEIDIEGYAEPIRCDRQYDNKTGGGIAVYFKNSVLHKEICSISCPELEATAVKQETIPLKSLENLKGSILLMPLIVWKTIPRECGKY